MAPLCYAAKFDPFLSLDCVPTPSTLAQSKERKGSNFVIWQPYTKVLIPPKDMMKKLHTECVDEKAVKEQIAYRVRWIRHQEAQKRRMEEEAERERVSYAQVIMIIGFT